MSKFEEKRGIVAVLIILIVAVIILGYFGFDIRRIIESPQVQENLLYLWNLIKIPFIWLFDLLLDVMQQFEIYLENLLEGNSNILDPNR